MSKERDEKFDPTCPTLIVKSGNTARKFRRLEKEVIVLGRAAGCDVGLEAPEVAAVHCVIVRAADGWRVRDCTGRGGTRLNGQSVQDASLASEDVLQIGSFSFEVHLPSPSRADGPAIGDAVLQRMQRSRHNLAQLALRLRGRLRKVVQCTAQRAETQLADRQEELDRQADELQQLQCDLDARLVELKQTAQEIAARKAASQELRRQTEKEIAERQAAASAALGAAMEEHQERCRQLEAAHARTLADQERTRLESVGDAPRRLEIRARELSCFADHLQRVQQRLNEHEDSLTHRWEEWLREQQQAAAAHAREREKIAREDALLREQRAEVVRLMGEMRQLRQTQRQPADLSSEALRAENERLRRAVADAQQEAVQRTAEADDLRVRLQAQAPEKNRVEPDGQVPDAAALNHFRVELETSRRNVDEYLHLVHGRYAEVSRAAREAEEQIGRERLRIAREQQELEQLRRELWPAGPSAGAETLIDMPSPLRHVPGIAPELETDGTDEEAPRAPSRLSALED